MGVPNRHILHQGSVLRALAGTAVAAFRQRGGDIPTAPPALPGPELVETIPPRPRELVRDYVKHVGGDPSAYKRTLPPHLFPQWGFGLAARTLTGIPYPLVKVMNGGCRLEVNAELPIDEPLEVRARLEEIDDDGRRAVLHQRIVTGTRAHPEAVVGHLYAIVPLGSGKSNGKPEGAAKARSSKDKPRVPADAREVAFFRVRHDAGLDFAKLTGDFNPVHWVPPYARAFGFKDVILHGFATMARAIEGLNRSVFAGDVHRIRVFDCKFTRPLVLPAKVGLYVTKEADQASPKARADQPGGVRAGGAGGPRTTNAHGVFVGDAPGGPAYLVGSFEADRTNGATR